MSEKKHYFLKNKDKAVVRFGLQRRKIEQIFNDSKIEEGIVEIVDLEILIPSMLPYELQSECTPNTLHKWIKKRRVPKNRAFVDKILNTCILNNDLMDYIDISLGFSLNDSYWIVPSKCDYQWRDYNLYSNRFDEMLERVAFDGISYQASELITTPEYTTYGALRKCWRNVGEEICLYKASSQAFANGGKEAYGEFYMAQVAQIMGLECVAYDLREYHQEIVSVCKLFTSEDIGFLSMYSCLSREERGLKKFDLLKAIQKVYGERALADLMIFDSLIYNTDRHLGNFGMLVSNKDNAFIKPAPIFDNGLCIFNFLSDDELSDIPRALVGKTSKFDLSFTQQMQIFATKEHIPMLENLREFEFVKHPQYNLPNHWLEMIAEFIRERAKEAIAIALKK